MGRLSPCLNNTNVSTACHHFSHLNLSIEKMGHEMHAVRYQFENKSDFVFGKKSFHVPTVKLFSKNKYNVYEIFYAFLFYP